MHAPWFRGPPSRSGSSADSSPGSIRMRSVGCWRSAPAAAPSPSPVRWRFPNAAVDAVDVSDAALELARENSVAHDVADRVRLSSSDVYDAVSGRYDLIVSNPPYVDAATMATLDPEYLHEPRIGLEAGADGLDCVRRIMAGASAHLHPGGVLVCEVGESRAALERAFPVLPFTWLELSRGGEGVFLLYGEQFVETESR